MDHSAVDPAAVSKSLAPDQPPTTGWPELEPLAATPWVARPPTSAPSRPQLVPSRKRLWPKVQKVIRRVHLYSGLALVPFVILYGVTAVLFNHPALGTDANAREVSVAELAAFGWRGSESADELAARILNAAGFATAEIDPDSPPRFRGRLAFAARANGLESTLTLGDPNGTARLVQRPLAERSTDSQRRRYDVTAIDASTWSVNHAAVDAWFASTLPTALPDDARSSLRNQLRLEFGLRDAGERLRAAYDFARGSLSIEPTDSAAPSMRSFLLRLHTAHGYPTEWGAAMVWAAMVDIMGVAMVLWAISGLVMWWQMRNLRRVGLWVLSACVVGAVPLLLGMWSRLLH